MSASPYKYSSSTHRFPDERTPIEATPLSTSAELGSGLGLGLGLGSHFSSHAPSHAPLLLATLLSHNLPFPRVHWCTMGKLVHTCLGLLYIIAHVLHCPLPPPAHSFIAGPAVINTHTGRHHSRVRAASLSPGFDNLTKAHPRTALAKSTHTHWYRRGSSCRSPRRVCGGGTHTVVMMMIFYLICHKQTNSGD